MGHRESFEQRCVAKFYPDYQNQFIIFVVISGDYSFLGIDSPSKFL